MENNKSDKKQKLLFTLIVSVLVIAIVGVSYAWFSITVRGNTTQVVQSGDLSLTIENENSLLLAKALPMPDSEGIKGEKEYTFTLSNNGTSDLDFVIKLMDDLVAQGSCPADLNSGSTCKFIPSTYIRYQVTEEGKTPVVGGLGSTGKVTTGTIKGKEKIHFTLKLWLGEDTPNEYQNSFYLGKLEITGTQNGSFVYSDPSGAASPELVEGLITVMWNGTDWVSVSASEKWYAYDEQWWANAVTTTETNRAKYQVPGTVIPISDINTMWVWIPRYEYQFSNMADQYAGGTKDSPGAIGINFIGKDVTTPSDAANYKVHPAFTFGTDELAGIWVGKFEPGNQTACTPSGGVANSGCDLTTLGVQIKPNVSSWRGIRVSTAFTLSRQMSKAGNAYGLNNTTTDSHMMKNTEWGAVAYLSQSIYGKYGNSAYSGANKEIYKNNYWNSSNSSIYTGCSAGVPSAANASTCAYTYEKSNTGTGASTTGTIYGVYDMSGGSDEYVMGNMKMNGNYQQMTGYQNSNNYNSGFGGINSDNSSTSGPSYPLAKYYDSYNYGTSQYDHSSRYIPGDATYEVSQGDGLNHGWYSDYAMIVHGTQPWYSRGSNSRANGNIVGIFSFSNTTGTSYVDYSFRLVLSPILTN